MTGNIGNERLKIEPSPNGGFEPVLKIFMLLLNTIPLLQVTLLILLISIPYASIWLRICLGVLVLYLLPPLLARIILWTFPLEQEKVPVRSRTFMTWWILLQLQTLFCRLPALEEALRIIPGLYSFWLRCWGARIGRLTYWAAGTLILDRSLVDIGDNVVFGAGVRVNPHVIQKNENGELELLVSRIKIGDNVAVGGYSLLTAGASIAEGESPHAFLIMPPFTAWKEGRRTKSFRDGIQGINESATDDKNA